MFVIASSGVGPVPVRFCSARPSNRNCCSNRLTVTNHSDRNNNSDQAVITGLRLWEKNVLSVRVDGSDKILIREKIDCGESGYEFVKECRLWARLALGNTSFCKGVICWPASVPRTTVSHAADR